jgi:hypothetical protein
MSRLTPVLSVACASMSMVLTLLIIPVLSLGPRAGGAEPRVLAPDGARGGVPPTTPLHPAPVVPPPPPEGSSAALLLASRPSSDRPRIAIRPRVRRPSSEQLPQQPAAPNRRLAPVFSRFCRERQRWHLPLNYVQSVASLA